MPAIKTFVCVILFTAISLNVNAVKASTLHLISIYGSSSNMREECDTFVGLFQDSDVYDETITKSFALQDYNDSPQALLNELETIANNVEEDDAVIIYVSTHGMYYRENDGYTSFYYQAWFAGKLHDASKFRAIFKPDNCKARFIFFVNDTCSTRLEEEALDEEKAQESDLDNDETEDLGDSDNVMIKGVGRLIKVLSVEQKEFMEYEENESLLSENIDRILNAKGFYYVASSLRGHVAVAGIFLEMFKKVLNEVDFGKLDNPYGNDLSQTELEKIQRFQINGLLTTMNNYYEKFPPYKDILFGISWEDDSPVNFGQFIVNLNNHIQELDRSEGVVVVFVQTSHPECPAMKAKLRKNDIVLGYILSNYEYYGGTWTYLNSFKDTFQLSKEMQDQKYIHLLIMRLMYDENLGKYYYKMEIVKNINLEDARKNMSATKNDLKFGMAALSYDEIMKKN